MHEQSLVRALLNQVDAVRLQHDGRTVSEVRVEMGPLSGVEPLLLATAVEQLVSESSAAGATLVIDEVPLLAECASCRQEFTVRDYVFRCPTCDGNVKVTRGDEFQLVSVSLQSSDSPQELVS